jgi:hypothetical protein
LFLKSEGSPDYVNVRLIMGIKKQIGFIERKGLYVFIHFKSGSDMVYVGEMKH